MQLMIRTQDGSKSKRLFFSSFNFFFFLIFNLVDTIYCELLVVKFPFLLLG